MEAALFVNSRIEDELSIIVRNAFISSLVE
jgi:hypothetical protein